MDQSKKFFFFTPRTTKNCGEGSPIEACHCGKRVICSTYNLEHGTNLCNIHKSNIGDL